MNSSGDRYPLSPMQSGMLFESVYSPNSGVNLQQQVMSLGEELDVPSFEKAWQLLASRHEVLRTRFSWTQSDEPFQEVCPTIAIPFELEQAPVAGVEARIGTYLREDRLRGFDLAVAPLSRVRVFRLGGASYQVVWTYHHILLDGRSTATVLRDLFALYDALREGREPGPDKPRPYREFIEWLGRRDVGASETYWRALLDGFPSPTPFGIDKQARREPPSEPDRGSQQVRLSEALAPALRSFAASHSLTLNTLIQGAWAILLSRYSREHDVVFGATRACRASTVEGSDRMVGLFINTLPVRARVNADAELVPFLRELRAQSIAARPHEHTPLVRIKEWSSLPRDRPLFESIVVFESYELDAALRAQGGPWPRRKFRTLEQTSYPLSLAVYDSAEPLVLLAYDRHRFADDAIRRMLGHFRTLLKGMADDPTGRISELPLVTDPELRRMRVEWNATKRDYPHACVHELFEQQAVRQPEAVAAAFEGRRITYRELDRRANQVAHQLRSAGVGPEAPVALLTERSLEMMAGMLGTWKAGGAYVPLDPAYPVERLRFMLEDSGARVLLASETLAPGFCASAPILGLESAGRGFPDGRPQGGATPGNLAYIMYTSGSTGRPKGVEIEHRNVAGFLHSFQPLDHEGERRVGTNVATFSFDTSVEEIFSCLCFGGTVHILRPEHSTDPRYFARYLVEHSINCCYIVPDLLEPVARELAKERERMRLRSVLTGLAPKKQRALQAFRDLSRDLRVLNAYGPTEVTYGATAYEFREATDPDREVPIGRPFPNYRVYIVDDALQPVPIGVAGELLIGGVGVARGYRNRPDLTAEKFVPDVFHGRPGARLYRTGDLARYLEDGNIEYLGRMDEQVKIRGFRIEPGEIESALAQHGAVERTAVTARRSPAGDTRLVAYVVAKEGGDVSPAGLRKYLCGQLPGYMVPSHFAAVDSLPLLPNGKVDRKALPEPDWNGPQKTTRPPRLRSEWERDLAGVWAELLGAGQVGSCDNFFELGGHSLLAVRLAGRLREKYSVEFPVRLVFDAPTLGSMAAAIAQVCASPGTAIPRRQGAGPAPLSFAQQRLWFLYQLEPASPLYNIPWATRLTGPLNVTALKVALDALAARHEILRTTIRNTEAGPVQVVSPSCAVQLARRDLSTVPAAARPGEARRLIREEASRPFDLTRDPMLRVLLVRLGGEEHFLLVTLHHIAADGWSVEVMARELGELYGAFSSGRRPELADLHIQYADYAVWQRDWLTGGVLETQLGYWTRQLAGAGVLQLPSDRPRPVVQTHRGGREETLVAPPQARRLRELAQGEGATLFMTLLAAFQALLHRYSGQEDISVGFPVANRTKPETQGLIGFLVNTLVLRTDFSGDPTFRQLLSRVRRSALEAYEHQDVPFEKLVEVLHPERDPSVSPLFQVMFSFEESPAMEFDLPGMSAHALDVFTETTKFDLTLNLRKREGDILAALTYSTDLFERTTALRMLDHFRTILEAAVADPDCPVSSLSFLTELEQRRMLVEWNDTSTDYPLDKCIHELLETQALHTPNAVAAVCAGGKLTYRELNEQANQLAHLLRSMGVGPDCLVGLCIERSLEMLVGLLGILKAGGAYVPMDPLHPVEHLSFLIQDGPIEFVVTLAEHARRLPEKGLREVCLDRDRVELAHGNRENPEAGVRSGNLAYVIYTSGSTGKPKGVMVEHRPVLNYVFGILDRFELDPGMSYAMVQPLTVDSSVTVLYASLFTGGCLHLVPMRQAVDPPALAEYFARHPVDVLKIAPSHLAALLSGGAPERLLPRRRLVIGGESSRREWAESLLSVVPGCAVFNHYGPTEATVGVTTYRLAAGRCGGFTPTVPIGRPLPNVKAYVLDSGLRPVPVGVPGELYLGGHCLARGYLNRPEQTAAHFIPDPFGGSGGRLYRTGDLVRYQADGNIEFLGRKDQQVKIRGFRVELSEIESVLAKHPGVREAVVAPWKDRLAAFVVPRGGVGLDLTHLRSFLREKMPDHMIPASFDVLRSLPRTPHGKLDRKALPAPEEVRPEPAEPLAVARDGVEAQLVKIWERVLGVRPVGLKDDFFDLGGHSLLAVPLFAEMEKVFGERLPLATLFHAPTVERLAQLLRDRDLVPAGSPLVPIQPRGSRPPFFAVHGQGGNVLFYRELARHLGNDQPFYGLQAIGLDGCQGPLTRVEDMATCYLHQVRAVQPRGPYYLGGFCMGAYVALEMARQLEADGEAVAFLASFASDGSWRTARSLRAAMALHLGRLSRLSARAKAGYVVQRLRFRRMRIGQSLAALIAGIPMKLNQPVSAGLRNAQVRECNYQANRKHLARPFGGAVTYFQPEAALLSAPQKFWGEMAAAGLEVCVVPGVEEDIFREPNVSSLARSLRACLDRAQSSSALP